MVEAAHESFKPDHKGQHVKVAWPSSDSESRTVYGERAAWIEFAEDGSVEHAREATPEEVRWWLLMRMLDSIRTVVIDVKTAVNNSPDRDR